MVKDVDDPYITAYALGSDKRFLDFGDATGISRVFQFFLGIVAVGLLADDDLAFLLLHYY
jgi:hypothetical protein